MAKGEVEDVGPRRAVTCVRNSKCLLCGVFVPEDESTSHAAKHAQATPCKSCRPSVGSTVTILNTRHTQHYFAHGIGKQFILGVDTGLDAEPYQVLGHDVWFSESDVRMATAVSPECSPAKGSNSSFLHSDMRGVRASPSSGAEFSRLLKALCTPERDCASDAETREAMADLCTGPRFKLCSPERPVAKTSISEAEILWAASAARPKSYPATSHFEHFETGQLVRKLGFNTRDAEAGIHNVRASASSGVGAEKQSALDSEMHEAEAYDLFRLVRPACTVGKFSASLSTPERSTAKVRHSEADTHRVAANTGDYVDLFRLVRPACTVGKFGISEADAHEDKPNTCTDSRLATSECKAEKFAGSEKIVHDGGQSTYPHFRPEGAAQRVCISEAQRYTGKAERHTGLDLSTVAWPSKVPREAGMIDGSEASALEACAGFERRLPPLAWGEGADEETNSAPVSHVSSSSASSTHLSDFGEIAIAARRRSADVLTSSRDASQDDTLFVVMPERRRSEVKVSPQDLALLDNVELSVRRCAGQLSELEMGSKTMTMSEYSQLSDELITVAAEAFECACRRNVAGAMDVFEGANRGIEQLGTVREKDCVPILPHSASPLHCRPVWTCLGQCLEGFDAILGRSAEFQ